MPELKSFALRRLVSPYQDFGAATSEVRRGAPCATCAAGAPVSLIDVFWAEVSDAVEAIEQLHEDSAFQDRKLAALVASKVYYHLGSYEDALLYALGAEELFDVNERSEYVDTMIGEDSRRELLKYMGQVRLFFRILQSEKEQRGSKRDSLTKKSIILKATAVEKDNCYT